MVCTNNHLKARFQADLSPFVGKEVKDAAWYYPEPITDKAAPIKDHVAFCRWNEAERKDNLLTNSLDKTKVEVKSE